MSNEALRMTGTKGLVGAIKAADAMAEAANVALIGYEKIGSGLVTVIVRGGIGAVKVFVDVGAAAVVNVDQVASRHAVPGPYTGVGKILPKLL